MESPAIASRGWLALQVGCVVISVFGSWFMLGGFLIGAVFISPLEPGSSGTPRDELSEIAQVAALSVAVIAAWRRNKLWLMSGVTSAVPLVIGLLLASGAGLGTLKAVSAEAKIVSTETEVDTAPESESEAKAPPTMPLTAEDAELSVRQLLELTAKTTGGKLADASGKILAPDAVSITTEPCMDDLADMSGSQFVTEFVFPSDPEGTTLGAVASAWKTAGYGLRHSQRSEMTYHYEYGAIASASVNDRETIDGLIHVRIEGRCIAPLN